MKLRIREIERLVEILIVLEISIFLIDSVNAQLLQVTDVSINPTTIWLNEDPSITISARCKFNGTYITNANLHANIRSPSGLSTIEQLSFSGGKYFVSIPRFLLYFSETGNYIVSITCEYNGYSAEKQSTFTAHKLEFSIVREGDRINAYIGDTLEIKVNFRLDGNLITVSKNDFDVEIGDEEVSVVSAVTTDNYQKITLDLCPDGNIGECMSRLPEGIYDLRVTATSSGRTITDESDRYIKVNAPLTIQINQNEIICPVNTLCEKDIPISVKFPVGNPDDFTKDDVTAVIMGNNIFKQVYINKIECTSGICTINVNIPSTLSPGLYDFFVQFSTMIDGNDYSSQAVIPLKIVLQISGELIDAAGNVVSASISFEDTETGQVISTTTDSNGRYSINLLPRKYNVEIRFGSGVITRFYNVTISESDSLLGISGNVIRFDQNHINSGAPGGLRLVKIIVIEFALPFSHGWVYVPYDSSLVHGDEQDLRVYECKNWNFEKSTCTGSWKFVQSKVHTIRDAMEFTILSTSAFFIGEQRALHFSNIEIEKEKVFMGDTVVVNGKVLDNDGNPVEGATIRLSFPLYNYSSTDMTTTGGFFRATIVAPYAEGYPTLLIQAIKEPYIGCNTTKTIQVSRSKELSILDVPDIVSVHLNEPTNLEFTIFNSGQTNLTEPIYVHIIGISSDWYELEPAKINGLAISEQKRVNLRIFLTPELCGGKCSKYTLVTIEVKSKEISKSVSFTLKILEAMNTTNQTSKPVEGGGGGRFIEIPNITGFVIVTPSITSPYLPLTIIIILLILIVNKKKTSGGGWKSRKKGKGKGKLRESVITSLHRIKSNL